MAGGWRAGGGLAMAGGGGWRWNGFAPVWGLLPPLPVPGGLILCPLPWQPPKRSHSWEGGLCVGSLTPPNLMWYLLGAPAASAMEGRGPKNPSPHLL